MYGNNSTFDGNAAFSGGGFMPSQATQTADHGFSLAKNRDTQTLLPLTVKQIVEAFQASDEKADFQIDGVDVNTVKLVGILDEKTEGANNVSFLLDDGTGRIACYRWVNEEADTKELELLNKGMYVKVHGHLKGFQGKKQLVVYSVRPVTDYNEIAHHFAECIYVHCYNTRLRKLPDAGQIPGHMTNSAVNTPSKGYQATPSNHVHFPMNKGGAKGLDELVLNYLRQPSCINREKGVHRNELAEQLNMDQTQISAAIEALDSEGLIYSTIDENHFKCTMNG